MPIQVQSFYPRLGVNALSLLKRPAGWVARLVANMQFNPLGSGVYARYMGPTPGAAQIGITTNWATIPNGAQHILACAQFLSDPLQRQSVESGDWTISFGGRLANALANYPVEGYCSIFVINGLTGQKRATVLNITGVGAFRSNTTERTIKETFTGLAFEIFTGDYLCAELGLVVDNTSGAARVPQATLFSDGAAPILADNQATTDAQAVIIAPVPFSLSLPQAGEPPGQSQTYEEVVTAVKRALPPSTFHDFDDPSTPDAELVAWLAQAFKSMVYDLVDILEREMDPSRASLLKLADWRRIFSMVQNPPKVEQLRALVIARLREYGGPASLFGVAAAVGTVLGYADPTQLEILEISIELFKLATTYTDQVPAFLHAIPEGTGFDDTNLIRRLPFTMDGGAIWETGVQLLLTLSAPLGQNIHAQLTGPDGTKKAWSPITRWDPRDDIVLYGREFAGKSMHGNWKLHIYRDVGSTPADLERWAVYAAGAPRSTVGPKVQVQIGAPPPSPQAPNVVRRAGLGQSRFWWGVYADPAFLSATVPADFGAARQALSRMRHAYQQADLVLTKEPIPDSSTALPNGCVPS